MEGRIFFFVDTIALFSAFLLRPTLIELHEEGSAHSNQQGTALNLNTVMAQSVGIMSSILFIILCHQNCFFSFSF